VTLARRDVEEEDEWRRRRCHWSPRLRRWRFCHHHHFDQAPAETKEDTVTLARRDVEEEDEWRRRRCHWSRRLRRWVHCHRHHFDEADPEA